MSEQSKKSIGEIKETFRRLSQDADGAGQKAAPLGDRELSTKIQKVREGAAEIVKHIEKRTGENS